MCDHTSNIDCRCFVLFCFFCSFFVVLSIFIYIEVNHCDELVLHQVLLFEKHAEELEAKIKGAKLAARKATKEQTKLEQEKMQQDAYVDRLRERVKELEREITLTKKQLEAQKEETEEARGNLRDAQMEIDVSLFES